MEIANLGVKLKSDIDDFDYDGLVNDVNKLYNIV